MAAVWYEVRLPDNYRSLDMIDGAGTTVLDLVGPNDGCRFGDQRIRFQHKAGLKHIECRYTAFQDPSTGVNIQLNVIVCDSGLAPSDSFSADCESLGRLHYKSLQSLCRHGGPRPSISILRLNASDWNNGGDDEFNNILRLNASDWNSAFATGVGCKLRMICSLMSSHSRNTTACYERLAQQQKLKPLVVADAQRIVEEAVAGADHAALTAFCMFPDRHYGSLFCNSVDEWEACYCPTNDAKMRTIILGMTQRNGPKPMHAEPVAVAEVESFLIDLCNASLAELQRECLNSSPDALRIMPRQQWAKCWAPLRRTILELIAFQLENTASINRGDCSSLTRLTGFIAERNADVVLHLAESEQSGEDNMTVEQLERDIDDMIFLGSGRGAPVFLL
jgi:hypothetical protein